MRSIPPPSALRGAGFIVVALLACARDPAPRVVVDVARPHTSASASTPPTAAVVACGSGACRSSDEQCCDEVCVPTSATCAGRARRCDDRADCAGDEVCCIQRDERGVGVIAACGRAPCAIVESCAPGGTCTRGLECASFDGPPGAPRRAECVPRAPRAHCGGRECPADSPMCCVGGSGAPRCTKPGEPCDSLGGALPCTTARDCAPYVCCDYKGVTTSCQDGCGRFFQGVVCESAADCGGRACDAVGEMLPGVKRCGGGE